MRVSGPAVRVQGGGLRSAGVWWSWLKREAISETVGGKLSVTVLWLDEGLILGVQQGLQQGLLFTDTLGLEP